MSSLLDYEEGDSDRAEFRRGFAHGAHAVFEVVGAHLDQGHADSLRQWLTGDVKAWTLAGHEPEGLPQAPSLLPQS